MISVLSKNGQLTVYPMVRDNEWIADYFREVQEYWRRVDEDEPYPEAIDNDYVADLDDMEEAETLIDLLENDRCLRHREKSLMTIAKEIDTGYQDFARQPWCEEMYSRAVQNIQHHCRT